MANDQLIAMLFPVGAAVAAIATGWIGLRFVAPQPTEHAGSQFTEHGTQTQQPSAASQFNVEVLPDGMLRILERDREGSVISDSVVEHVPDKLHQAARAIKEAESALADAIQSSNGGNF